MMDASVLVKEKSLQPRNELLFCGRPNFVIIQV